MSPSDRNSAAAICLFAALADGGIHAQEQASIQRTIRDLTDADADAAPQPGTASSPSDVYQRVVLGQTDVAREAANLSSPEVRRQAYELAVAVCAADGATSPAEQQFLSQLSTLLAVAPAEAASIVTQANQLATVAAAKLMGGGASGVGASKATDAELDDMILNASILNAALELLPHALASMAIIPLQMRLVYRIGQMHGYNLDRGHIGEFLGVLGIGATSQMLESVAGRLVGGLLGGAGRGVFGGLAGSLGGSLGRTVGSSAVAFASTWAMGQVARQYYAGGRTLSAVDLRQLFDSNVSSAQGMVDRYLPQIRSRAASLSPASLVSLARGEIGI